jgi:hypothetical protein
MSDSEAGTVEVAEVPAPKEAQNAPSAPDAVATLQKQLSAADAARVQSQNETARIKAERDAFATQLAEIENSNKSELEKAIDKAKAAEARADKAETEKERIRLESKYPHAVAEFGDEPLFSEARLAALEKKLAPAVTPETPEAPALVHNPAKVRTPVTPERTSEDARKDLLDAFGLEAPAVAAQMRGH